MLIVVDRRVLAYCSQQPYINDHDGYDGCLSITSYTMRHPDYPIWTFLGFIAVTFPATWHWRSRNISTLSIIAWLALGNLSLFINTLVWADNYRDWSPVWCDICELVNDPCMAVLISFSQSPFERYHLCHAGVLPIADA